MNSRKIAITSASLALAFFSIFAIGNEKIKSTIDRLTEKNSAKLVREGSDIFRYDTFGESARKPRLPSVLRWMSTLFLRR
jgi:hypothetical protein